MIDDPVLQLPDHTKPFEVHTDASDYVIGGMLVQQGNPHMRAESSMRPKGVVQEKEMTAIVHYLRTWRRVTICGQDG